LLRNERSSWPVLVFLVAVVDVVANALSSSSFAAFWIAAVDCGEILIVATLARALGVLSLDDGLKAMFRLMLICLCVPVMSAAEGAGILAFYFHTPLWVGWKTWYLATAFGLLMVTPLLLSWSNPTLRAQNLRGAPLHTMLMAGVVAVIGYFDFHDAEPGLFLAFPFLLFAAFNGRLLGATTAAALSVVAIWSTWQGNGPIATLAHAGAVTKIQNLQLYIAVVLLSSLPVAAILEQRETLMARLRETTKAAQSAARAKSEFVAVMSHEIRTPMTGVLGLTDLLMKADLPAKERQYVAGIRASGRHLLNLINDILDFSRIEAGKLDLETIDFSIADLLEQVQSLLAPQAAERGLTLRFDAGSQPLPVLRGDPTRLKQVLVNLAGNGLKFTRAGSVAVTVRRHTFKDEHDRFRFEVRDTGIGIPEEKRAILFEAFAQADSSTTRQYGGSGLGLAICKQLVEAMAGEIGVESTPGRGSCFWFEVPLALGENTSIAATPRRVAVSGACKRVLLVEDVELNQVLIADMLQAHGHEVTLAANGLEAIALAAREPFDVILMDVQMPVMDGVEATQRIRKLPPPAGLVPVLALSANVVPAEQARYIAAGMNGALAKPIDWQKLFDALVQYGGPGKIPELPASAPSPETAPLPQPAAAPAVSPPSLDKPHDSPIDPAVLEQLHRLQDGTRNLTAKLAEIFIRDTGRRLTDLGDAVQRADADTTARIAHAIKGSAANLGAQMLVRICADIETAAEAADLTMAPARLEELQREFTRARDALKTKQTVA
jgi:two-component system, sensor histidine kinase